MDNSVRVWVPAAKERPVMRKLLIEAAGGLTMTNSFGVWTGASGDPIFEPVIVYEAFYKDSRRGPVEAALAQIVNELFKLREEAVLTETNGHRTEWHNRLQAVAA